MPGNLHKNRVICEGGSRLGTVVGPYLFKSLGISDYLCISNITSELQKMQ